MRKLAARLLLLGATLLVLVAADVTGALNVAEINITETSGSTQTNVVAFFPLSSEALIDNSFAADDLLNTQLCVGGTTCGASDEVVFMPSPSNTSLEFHEREDTTGGSFTSELTDWSDAGADDATMFDGDPEVNDANYFGFDTPTRILRLNIGTAGVGTWTITWEYYNGAWTALSNVADGTTGFTVAGTNAVSYDMPTDWTTTSIDGDTSYWIRGRISAFTSSSTDPLGTQAWYEVGVWWAWLSSISGNEQRALDLYTGGADIRTEHHYIPASAGVITTHDASLLPGSTDLQIEVRGYFDVTQTGSPRDIAEKGTNIVLRHDASTSGTITFLGNVQSGSDCDLSTTGVTEGVHTIRIELDPGTDCEMFIDASSVDTDVVVGGLMQSSSSDINWFSDGSMEYVEFGTWDVNGIEIVNYELDTTWSTGFLGDFIEDQAGGDNDGLPSFPTLSTTLTGVTGAFVTTDAPDSQDVSTETGDAVGILQPTGTFAGSISPSTSAPLYDFFAQLAGQDADSQTAGIQEIPITFFYLFIVILVMIAVVGGITLFGPVELALVIGLVPMVMFLRLDIVNLWFLVFYGVMMGVIILYKRGLPQGGL